MKKLTRYSTRYLVYFQTKISLDKMKFEQYNIEHYYQCKESVRDITQKFNRVIRFEDSGKSQQRGKQSENTDSTDSFHMFRSHQYRISIYLTHIATDNQIKRLKCFSEE